MPFIMPSVSSVRRSSVFLFFCLGLYLVGQPGIARGADKIKFGSVADYRKCIDRGDPEFCLEALDVFVKGHPGEAFAAGKAVRATVTHWSAIPYFAKALGKNSDAKNCPDPDVTMALISALSLPASRADVVSAARAILFDKCWAETHDAVLKKLAEPGSTMAENVCPGLAAKKQASPACDKKPVPAPTVVAVPPWKEIDPKTMAVEDPVKVFRGSEGKSVTLVKVKGAGDAYLIKFEGFRGAWNGRIVLHREHATSSGYDYFTQIGGDRWVSVVARGEGTLSYEVYPSGDKGPFHVGYDEQASKATAAKIVLDQFTKQRK